MPTYSLTSHLHIIPCTYIYLSVHCSRNTKTYPESNKDVCHQYGDTYRSLTLLLNALKPKEHMYRRNMHRQSYCTKQT